MSKAIRVRDLKDQIHLGPRTNDDRAVLYCRKCGDTYSANAGDYWNALLDHVFKHCGINMQRVVQRTVNTEV